MIDMHSSRQLRVKLHTALDVVEDCRWALESANQVRAKADDAYAIALEHYIDVYALLTEAEKREREFKCLSVRPSLTTPNAPMPESYKGDDDS